MRFIVCLIVFLAPTAWARIGESYETCVKRYGSPERLPSTSIMVSGPGTTNVLFNYKGWRLHVGFIRGVARIVEYYKPHKEGQPPQITNKEFASILQAYSSDPWTKVRPRVTLNPIAFLRSSFMIIAQGDSWRSKTGLIVYKRAGGSSVRVVDQLAIDLHDAEMKRRQEQEATPPPKI